MTEVECNRLRWRCRRGLLENDLILSRFIEARGATFTEEELRCFDKLLSMPDGALWDVLSGRAEPDDGELSPLLAQLRIA
ncbi:MAG: succinate dehydrogenase assembly factor 2 [Pseudomonadota bacterium]|nr:succinate dehydrogenase assembly factor 2 [Pseudomonadota bacterium]